MKIQTEQKIVLPFPKDVVIDTKSLLVTAFDFNAGIDVSRYNEEDFLRKENKEMKGKKELMLTKTYWKETIENSFYYARKNQLNLRNQVIKDVCEKIAELKQLLEGK